MMTHTFEIKVALLGHVSVGKSTVLNALLREKFSEVSMRRTTAGVNFFRNHTSYEKFKAENGFPNGTVPAVIHTAESTLAEITQDNKVLREANMVKEKTFHIELHDKLCEMCKDTSLVFVDIPGLNEAGSQEMYLNYVSHRWDTFDCVIVVMDVDKRVNTEEHVRLLKFVNEKIATVKRIPVIVLCNKVDDLDDDEVMEIVDEVRTTVEQTFHVGDRKEALDELLTAHLNGKRSSHESLYPVFIPLSAGNAFLYRMAASCSPGKFLALDLKLIDKIGRNEIGKGKWKQLSLDDKYDAAIKILHHQYHEHIEATNFDKLLTALSYSIGGHDVQRALLQKQMQLDYRALSDSCLEIQKLQSCFHWCKVVDHHVNIADRIVIHVGPHVVNQVQSIFDKCKAVGCDPTPLKGAFWNVFEKMSNMAMTTLGQSVDPSVLADLFDLLIAYDGFASKVEWKDERVKIVAEATSLVGVQVSLIFEHESIWKIDGAPLSRYCFGQVLPGHMNRKLEDFSPGARKGFPFDWQRDGRGWLNLITREKFEGSKNPVPQGLQTAA